MAEQASLSLSWSQTPKTSFLSHIFDLFQPHFWSFQPHCSPFQPLLWLFSHIFAFLPTSLTVLSDISDLFSHISDLFSHISDLWPFQPHLWPFQSHLWPFSATSLTFSAKSLTFYGHLNDHKPHYDKVPFLMRGLKFMYLHFQYHGNDVEMFFVKAGSEPLLFSLDDLILAEDVVQGNLIKNVKKKVPALNITTIYTQVSLIGHIFVHFLAHLSRWAYSIARHLSSVVNIFKRHLWSHEADSYHFTYSIYRLGGQILTFFVPIG